MLWLICECGVLCKAEVVFLSCCGLISSETNLTFPYLWLSCIHAWEKWDRTYGLGTEGFLCMWFISCLCQNSASVGNETTTVQNGCSPIPLYFLVCLPSLYLHCPFLFLYAFNLLRASASSKNLWPMQESWQWQYVICSAC